MIKALPCLRCGQHPIVMCCISTAAPKSYYVECFTQGCPMVLGQLEDDDGDVCGLYTSEQEALLAWNAKCEEETE